MKAPLSPPSFSKLRSSISPERMVKVVGAVMVDGPAPHGEYLHWDKLRHKVPPEGLSHEEWWFGLKAARGGLMKHLPLVDKEGAPFLFTTADPVLERIYRVDRDAAGQLRADGTTAELANPQTRDTYLMRSLMEESITSSQLEGAATTREVAKAMLREGRRPTDLGERMIFNNFRVMSLIRERLGEPLSVEWILEMHRVVSEGTLDDPSAVGRFRRADEKVNVVNASHSEVLHVPPAAEELPERLERLCRFANDRAGEPFVHPLLRAVILHFMLGYDHPFVDGNGRTARALFYWSALSEGYWLLEYVSISHVLRLAPAQYARAYLYSETDGNDLTYFLIHQLMTISKGIDALHHYLQRKREEVRGAEQLLSRSPVLRDKLNHRQVALLRNALKHPDARYTIEGHRVSHNVAYQTARTDLFDLVEWGLLERRKRGRAFLFLIRGNLRDQLRDLS